ncbi:Transcriptional repressor PifC [Mixta theicola]|nr:hypothetical protein [Mixta theicola]QHM75169.1 Transcriptional repressor PifC [Mixta theicola]
MLSQLTLRFPKNLTERLRNRAATESTSVNTLAERLLEDGLATDVAGEEYLRLVTDPDAALEKLYCRLVLGQTLGAPEITADTVQFLLELAHQGYARGPSQLVSTPRLRTLLEITFALLDWHVENDRAVDSHYLRRTFGIKGEDWHAEGEAFLATLTPAVTQDHAEQLLRLLTVYHHHPDVIPQGWQGHGAMFSTRATAAGEVILGLDALRVFMSEEAFTALAGDFVTRCERGELHQTLESLRCIYGDL